MKVAMEIERDTFGTTDSHGWHQIKVVDVHMDKLTDGQRDELHLHRVGPEFRSFGDTTAEYKLPAYDGLACVYTARIADEANAIKAIEAWRTHRAHFVEEERRISEVPLMHFFKDIRHRDHL